MRRRALLRLVLSALILAAAGLVSAERSPAFAQDYPRYYDAPRGERGYRQQRRAAEDDDAYFESRMRYYRRDAVARRQAEQRARRAAVERERSGISIPFFRRLFGGSDPEEDVRERPDPGGVEVRPRPRPVRRKPPPAIPTLPPPAATAIGPQQAAPQAPQVAPTTFVAVFGDSIADGLAGGLVEGFSDAPELAVRRHVKANAGLVRADYFDFVEEAKKAVAAGPITYAVIDVGVNDRQPFIDMRHAAPLSEEWLERYGQRIDALLAVFKDKKIPVYWVGLAPSESRKATADHITLNALAKERVEAADGTYVDVWEGFVDEDGAYAAVGPQLDGQTGRLRLDDGVHFSRAGARKLAHYAEREIRKVFAPKPVTPEAIAGAPDADAQAALPPLPLAVDRPRPVSSPVVVLTAPRRAEGGALAAAALAVPAANASPDAERVLIRGEASEAAPGRMDDASWPGVPPAAAPTAPAVAPAPPPTAQTAPAR